VAKGGKAGTTRDQQELARAAAGLAAAARALPQTVPKRRPITTGVGEPFVVSLTVSFYFALIISLPILLYQVYAFVLPAFSPTERKIALPLMLGVPFLFIAGVAFAYFLVLPPAIGFLQNFNDETFDVLLQAKDYYRFAVFTLLAVGIAFQIPVGALASPAWGSSAAGRSPGTGGSSSSPSRSSPRSCRASIRSRPRSSWSRCSCSTA